MANYPEILDNFTPKVDDTNDVMAADVNDLQTAIVALQTKVGVDNSIVETTIEHKVAAKENSSNKVTSLSVSSTDAQYPSAKLVYDQLAGKQATGSYEVTTNKENTTLDTSTTKYPTNRLVKEYADGKVEDNITDGHTTIAPSGNAVFDALAGKASLTGAETLTNKRINARLVTAASYTTDTGTSLSVATCDQFEITAQAGALLFNAPGGTPLGGQKLIIRIKDNGTARALTYNAIFRAMGNALPTTTVLSKTLYMGFIYNATDSKWDLVAVAQEA